LLTLEFQVSHLDTFVLDDSLSNGEAPVRVRNESVAFDAEPSLRRSIDVSDHDTPVHGRPQLHDDVGGVPVPQFDGKSVSQQITAVNVDERAADSPLQFRSLALDEPPHLGRTGDPVRTVERLQG